MTAASGRPEHRTARRSRRTTASRLAGDSAHFAAAVQLHHHRQPGAQRNRRRFTCGVERVLPSTTRSSSVIREGWTLTMRKPAITSVGTPPAIKSTTWIDVPDLAEQRRHRSVGSGVCPAGSHYRELEEAFIAAQPGIPYAHGRGRRARRCSEHQPSRLAHEARAWPAG